MGPQHPEPPPWTLATVALSCQPLVRKQRYPLCPLLTLCRSHLVPRVSSASTACPWLACHPLDAPWGGGRRRRWAQDATVLLSPRNDPMPAYLECGPGLMNHRVHPLVLSCARKPASSPLQVLDNPFVTHIVTTQPGWSRVGLPAPMGASQRGCPQPSLLTPDGPPSPPQLQEGQRNKMPWASHNNALSVERGPIHSFTAC